MDNVEKALIEEVSRGNDEAFYKIVEKYKQKVFNLAYRMLSNYDEANDVSQEAFVKLFYSLKKFRGEASLYTYLYSITSNLCKNRIKKLVRRRKMEPVSLNSPIETEEGVMQRELASPQASPAEELERKEKRELIQKAIDELGYEFKEVVVLRDVEGLSYEEVSKVLNVSIGTVKSRVHRARNMLQEKLRGVI